MGLLDIEKDRLKKHYLELDGKYSELKEEAEKTLTALTERELGIVKKFVPFADLYIKINGSPDFRETDVSGDKKEKMDMHDLKEKAQRVIEISHHIVKGNTREYAAISMLGTDNLLKKADELNIGSGVNIREDELKALKGYLEDISGRLFDVEIEDKNLKVDLKDDSKILDFEKRMHAAISDLKEINHKLSEVISVCGKYNEKLEYIAKLYERDVEILREYVDFSDTRNWKVLDENQDAMRAMHSNVTEAQILYNMCRRGITDSEGKNIDCKAFEKMISRADEVIDVIDVYTRVNVF